MRSVVLTFLFVFTALPVRADVSFDRKELTVVRPDQSSFSMTVEVADTPAKQARGLMFRTDLPDNEGMLFDFREPRPVTMWMANTPLSLDMVFFDNAGTVKNIVTNTVPFSRETIPSGFNARGVLEVRAGSAKKLGIDIDAKIVFSK